MTRARKRAALSGVAVAGLDGSQHCLAHWLTELDRGKVCCRIQVVISGLIDYAELPMPRGIGIRKHLIDFSGLQGNLVALVLQANNELLWRFHSFSVKVALDLELFASDAVSFVAV